MINSQLQWLLDLRDNHNYYSKAGQIVIEVQTHTHIYIFFNSYFKGGVMSEMCISEWGFVLDPYACASVSEFQHAHDGGVDLITQS